MMVGAISEGVLFALPLTLAVRGIYLLTDSSLSESAYGTLFVAFALAAGAFVINAYARDLSGSSQDDLTADPTRHEKSQPCISA